MKELEEEAARNAPGYKAEEPAVKVQLDLDLKEIQEVGEGDDFDTPGAPLKANETLSSPV